MTKLHELLAVESSLEKTGYLLVEESKRNFGKENLFTGEVKDLIMFNDEDSHLETRDVRILESTVMENISYTTAALADYFDVVLQKDAANQAAKADLELEDGTILARDLPATFLLGLETKLNKLRELYNGIPTLEPGIDWVKDELERPGVYKTNNGIITFRTKKDTEFKVAYPATDKHPAQVHAIDVTVNVGKFVTMKFSGKMSSLDKANILSRLDSLIKAVKRARSRANEQVVDTKKKVGADIFNYIHEGF